ncbi:MAG: hypothetical protein MUF85_00240 [Patescibacteria group bacterium]|jgi:hypothetical protein|nr:hypothetical protein [Patescibacteria group bacterium]
MIERLGDNPVCIELDGGGLHPSRDNEVQCEVRGCDRLLKQTTDTIMGPNREPITRTATVEHLGHCANPGL